MDDVRGITLMMGDEVVFTYPQFSALEKGIIIELTTGTGGFEVARIDAGKLHYYVSQESIALVPPC